MRVSRRVRARCRLEDPVVRDRPARAADSGVGIHQNAGRSARSIEEIENVVVRDDVAGVELSAGCAPRRDDRIVGSRCAIADIAMVDRVVVVASGVRSRDTEEHDAACRAVVDAVDRGVLNRVPGRTIDESNSIACGCRVLDLQLRRPCAPSSTVDDDVRRPVHVDRRRSIRARDGQVCRASRRPNRNGSRRRAERAKCDRERFACARVRRFQLDGHIARKAVGRDIRQRSG